MTKEEFIAEIESQKLRGEKLLQQVQQMHIGKNDYGDSIAVFGTPRMYYTPKEELEPVKTEYESWKCYVHDLLLSVLNKDDDFISEWDLCLQQPYRRDVSDKVWYSKEINKALGKLDSFTQRIGFRLMDNDKQDEIDNQVGNGDRKTPMVFISHSSVDKSTIDSFIDNVLVMGLGLSKNEIAYTSNEVYGVAPGDDISRYIKENIEAAEVVLLMISDNYKQSEVCLNEMGAAWALDKPFISILLPNTGYDKLGWLTNLQKAVRMENREQVISLCQKIVGLVKTVDIQERLSAIVSYTDKFIGTLLHTSDESKSLEHNHLQTYSIDEVVSRAISELGEFTIKELQEATEIKNYHFLSEKINAMVAHGDLDAIGGKTNRKYKIKV